MTKDKIFISHSAKDIKIVESFVENVLRLGLDISADRIFCSSMEGHGVKSGQYIPDRLREEIKLTSIALLFISKNYKSSEICLNEVGAAWITLDKENVIPMLLPNIEFTELGFLDIGRLGLKIYERSGILTFIQDNKEKLNPSFHIGKLHKQIDIFIDKIEAIDRPKDFQEKVKFPNEVRDYTICFEDNLIPFDDIIRQAIPAYDDGIYEIIDTTIQNKILTNLSKADFLKGLWYKQAEGDFYVEKLKKTPTGNWLISVFNWEIKISSMWVSKNVLDQYEFILLNSAAQEPYKIDSDIGGTSYNVGMLNDGTIVNENERLNGYAIIGGETIVLNQHGVEPRYRDRKSHWVFFVTDFHKAGFNANATINFCKKLDSGEIKVNQENIMKFLSSLSNHPTIMKYS